MNVFSVCHSLSQTVTDVTLFTFWHITLSKAKEYTEYMSHFLAHIVFFKILGVLSLSSIK